MEKQDYTVTNEGWVDGVWREKDEPLKLTEREAEHLLAGGIIARVPEEKAEGSLRLSARDKSASEA